jgi:uncharacterized protein
MHNPVGWFEIYVQDMERAKRFYAQVFGTEFTRLQGDGFDIEGFPMSPDVEGISGALVHMPGFESGLNSVLVYFKCEDCAVEAAKAASAGGQLFKAKTAIGPYGHIALICDTEGNMIGLHSMQ